MNLIVGLGNPGKEYEHTRHNLGFMALDLLHADDFSVWKQRDGAEVARGVFAGAECMLVKPQRFMNLSGAPVAALLSYYKISPADMIVVHDELDLPFGTVRAKAAGSSAGHRGVQDIIEKIGTDAFTRVRLGIGLEDRAVRGDAAEFVLEKFTKDEQTAVRPMLDAAVEKLRSLIVDKSEKTS